MEQLVKVVGIRLTEEEYKLLEAEAAEQKRKVAYVAREKLRKGLAN